MLKITLLAFAGCWVLENVLPGWKLPKVRTWNFRVVGANLVQLIIVLIAGRSWELWLSSRSLFHLSKVLNPFFSGFIAYFIATFVFYLWHRLRHDNDFLWRHFHQIHHSPQRLEVITSFYKHPIEMIANSILGSLLVYTLLGLNLKAGAIYTLFTALGEFFYHTNIKTPHWVGYVFQRPEMHRIHHENETLELRLKDMLAFKDVHRFGVVCALVLVGLLRSGPVNANTTKFSSWQQACTEAESMIAEGDLVFLDSPNFLFRRVAQSTGSWVSHVGIALRNDQGQWMVKERRVRSYSVERPLCDFIESATAYQFEIKRFARGLRPGELDALKKTIQTMPYGIYDFGFNFDSNRPFCSKFVYQVYQSIGIEVGKIQTFGEILSTNPSAALTFWRVWFFGKIPWERRTITPASQLNDPKFVTVLNGAG